MAKVPNKAKAYISNANYYLAAARKISDDLVGVRIFLLLTAWENARLAEEQLHAWAQKTSVRKRIDKSHPLKLDDVRKPIIELVQQANGKLLERCYLSAEQLSKLLETCRYGLNGGETELSSFFSNKKFTRWHTDEFERGLESKIAWAIALVKAQEAL